MNARGAGRARKWTSRSAEAVFALMESTVADFELGGVVRTRNGGVLKGVAPSNAYPTSDGRDIVIAANADAVFARLCDAMGRPELATDACYAEHEARGARQDELDDEIARWSEQHAADDLLMRLERHSVPCGLIHAAPDLAVDPQFMARDMVLRLAAGFDRPVPMAGVVPKLSRTPGSVRAVGPALGEHTDEILRDLAGFTDQTIQHLRVEGIVA